MSLEQLLADLTQRGIKISVVGDKLRVRAPKGRVTPELRTTLKQSKPELLTLLRKKQLVVSSANGLKPIPLMSRETALPVSIAQERLWLVDQLQPGSSTYNLPMAFRLTGQLDEARLEKALQTMVQRHEVLRTTYPPSSEGPSIAVEPTAPALTVIDLTMQSEPDVQALGLVAEMSKQPFELAQGPLIRYSLICLAPQEFLLVIVVHHMVADGWSLGLIISEISALYSHSTVDKAPLSELPYQYADFAAWQKQWLVSEKLTPQVDYWQQIFADPPEALTLPLDHPYSTGQSTKGRCQTFNIDSALSQTLKTYCQQEGKSQFTVFLASFKAILHCYSGQNDLIVCSPVAGRNRSDTQQLIGYFNNILPLRTQVSSHQSFSELIRQEQKTVTAIYDYPDVPLQKIADLPNLAGIPLSRALFVLQSQQNGPQQALTLADVTAQPLTKEEMGVDTADFDLAIFIEPTPNHFGGYIQYKTELFDQPTVEQFFRHWMILLERALEQPEATLSELQPLGTVERQQLKDKVDTLNHLLAKAEQDQSAYVAPRNPVELQLVQIWQTVLGLDQIGVNDNFFDLGGSSLLALQMFNQIKMVCGQKLPLATLLQAPTVGQLAEVIRQQDESEPWTPIVPLQPHGDKPPFFCVCGRGGHVLNFRVLASLLDSDQPFYGLESRALDGQNSANVRIEDMAADYIQEICAFQPEGPYFIGGYSFGGIVAFEMAQQLRQQGKKVALLVLFDSIRDVSPLKRYVYHAVNLLRFRVHPVVFGRYLFRFLSQKLEQKARGIKFLRPLLPSKSRPHWSATIDEVTYRVAQANYQAVKDYNPQVYRGDMTILRASERDEDQQHVYRDPNLGWGNLIGGTIDVHSVPGYHGKMLSQPHVQEVAKQLEACLDKAQGTYSNSKGLKQSIDQV